MRHGVQGALQDELVELGRDIDLERLKHTPAAALGSCRYKLRAGDAQRLAKLCRDNEVDAWIYIGGNDSAATSLEVARASTDISVIGVPKTIDNDLPGTDHCPGYGSAARFVASVTLESAQDTRAMRFSDPIRIIETAGRHAGWLPGSAWLARTSSADLPLLVYVPERPRGYDHIRQDVSALHEGAGYCVMVLSENQPGADGRVLGGSAGPRYVDPFGNEYFDSPAQWLAQKLSTDLRVRVRYDKPGIIQRSALGYVSSVDRWEAELVGREAVRLAAAGQSGVMVTLLRGGGTGTVALETVANEQRRLPPEFINADGNGLTQAFTEYALPLLGEPLPRLAAL
jgi:ATP-dependent phosphofructokinase / diphosphate-dependent phosphofructokinase